MRNQAHRIVPYPGGMPTLAPIATVLVDEAHAQAWTIRPDVAARHPALATPRTPPTPTRPTRLRRRGFAVDAHAEGPLTDDALAGTDVLVLAPRLGPALGARRARRLAAARPTPSSTRSSASSPRGGGLLVLGECEQDKYGNRLNDLLGRFGFHLGNDTVSDYVAHHQAPALGPGRPRARVPRRAARACFYRAGVLDALPDGARVLARAAATSSAPGAPLLAVADHGAGRVVVLADSDLFGDDCLGEFDHEALLDELVHWAARHAFAHEDAPVPSDAAADPALDAPARGDRRAAPAPAARRRARARGRPRPGRRPRRPDGRGDRGARRALRAPGRPPRGRRSATCAAGRPAASGSPTSRPRSSASAPTSTASTASSTSSSSRCTSRTARATGSSRP